MTLLPDWKKILTKAWSVRAMIAAAVLSGIETALQLGQSAWDGNFPPGVFAAVAGIFSLLGVIARAYSQKEFQDAAGK